MIRKSLLMISIIVLSAAAWGTQPNKQLTPGGLCTEEDSDFLEYRYAEHIAYCKRNVSREEKVRVAAAYGIPESEWSNYEFDHLIPLSAGGTSHEENIWPQPLSEAREKDRVEEAVFEGMRDGRLTQAEGVKMIWDWIDQH